jgi:hypothetical protein
MNSMISLPREALAEWLKTSGSPLTPEQFVALLSPGRVANPKYPKRAWAAALSKPAMMLIMVLSVGFTLFSPDIENIVISIGLVTVTFFEYRVHRYFKEGNPAAPSLGFRNQSGFAAGILVYCLYHAFAPLAPEALNELREASLDSSMTQMIPTIFRTFYLGVGILGGLSQFALAWYYRSAQE